MGGFGDWELELEHLSRSPGLCCLLGFESLSSSHPWKPNLSVSRIARRQRDGQDKISRVWISLEKEPDKQQGTIRKLPSRAEKAHYLQNPFPTHNPLGVKIYGTQTPPLFLDLDLNEKVGVT